MRLLFAFLLLLSLTGCRWESDTYCDPSERILPARPDEETMYYHNEFCRVINEYATELGYYRQIWLEHSYAERGDDGRFVVWVDFSTQANVDLENARRISVFTIDSLLDKLNSSEILMRGNPGPFTFHDLYFSIEYTSFYGKYNDPLLVGRSELKYGYMDLFYAHDAFKLDPIVYHKHSEPFETSRCIVAAQNATLQKIDPSGKDVFDHIISPEDWLAKKSHFIRESAKKFDAYEYQYHSALSNYTRYSDSGGEKNPE